MKRRRMSGDNDPQQRLLKAGEEIFALVGYRQATIRDISRRANVNVAMVSYYFGGKKHLYRAVLEHSMGQSFQRHVSSSRPPSHATPEERLHVFVVALLSHVLDKTDYASNGRLMAREMVEPTFALDIVVDKIIRPWSEEAGSIVRAFLGPEATDEEVFLFEQTVIVAQCLHYRHNRPILDRLHPSLQCGPENIRRLAEHITRFSLGALRAFRRPNTWTRTSPEVSDGLHPDRRVISRSPMRRKTPHDGGPKERLLKAGEDLFALLGYQHATIREISQRANVNVAMVNYYFGGKEGLYREVLERSLRESVDRYVAASRPPDNASPEERLHAFVLALLSHVLDEGSASIGQLMSREMTEPTTALDTVVDKVIRPRSKEAISIVRAFLGPDANDEDVTLYEQSIVAQCLHHRHNRPILDRLRPSVKYGPSYIPRLAQFITRSSVGALLAVRLAIRGSQT